MKLEVGMYVRTKYGITQYKGYNTINGKLFCMPVKDGTRGIFANIEDIIGEPSFNIIDLIEENDYIRIVTSGYFEPVYYSYGKLVIRDDIDINKYTNKFIAEVITHEQMKSMSYKVGE